MRTFVFALAAIVPASCVIGQAGAADGSTMARRFGFPDSCAEARRIGVTSIAVAMRNTRRFIASPEPRGHRSGSS